MKKLLSILALALIVYWIATNVVTLATLDGTEPNAIRIVAKLLGTIAFLTVVAFRQFNFIKKLFKSKNDDHDHRNNSGRRKPIKPHVMSKPKEKESKTYGPGEIYTIKVKSVPRFHNIEIEEVHQNFYVPDNFSEIRKKSESMQRQIIALFNCGFREDVISQLNRLSEIDDTTEFLENNPQILKFIFA